MENTSNANQDPLKAMGRIRREQEERQAKRRAQKSGYPYINLDVTPINAEDISMIEEERAKEANVATFNTEGNNVYTAVLSPEDPKTQNIIKEIKEDGLNPKIFIASKSSLKKAWGSYEQYKETEEKIEGQLKVTNDVWEKYHEKLSNKKEIEPIAKKHSNKTDLLLGILMIGALNGDASDIHIEPGEETARVRYRIDGVLEDVATIPMKDHKYLSDRVKILADIKVNLQNAAQDGRFSVHIEEQSLKAQDIDIRLSILPSAHGETIVMRLLNTSVTKLELEALGMEPSQLEKMKENANQPNGIILTTGPTGSGKTTTLYATLNEVKDPSINIITLENPIEYKIEGITQTQINEEEGYTFAKGLESILRQDPDVILVGEIRNKSTANTAINASLTGHLVLSTVHTNDSVAAVDRLQRLGVRNSLIGTAGNLFLAQRLVRELCENCKEPYDPPAKTKRALKETINSISPKSNIGVDKNKIDQLYKPVGCEECFGTGYQGRTGIFELFELTDKVKDLLVEDKKLSEIRQHARKEGMISVMDHGLIKVIRGTTSIKEVSRVAGDIDMPDEEEVSIENELEADKEVLEKVKELDLENKTIEKYLNSIENNNPERFISSIILIAKNKCADAVYIKPKPNHIELKLKIDGVTHSIAKLSESFKTNTFKKIKEIADINENNKAGSFGLVTKKGSIDVRIVKLASNFGEQFFVDLDTDKSFNFDINSIGLKKKDLKETKECLEKPSGLSIVGGPAASGKTTTLYSFISYLGKEGKKAITVEETIEKKLKNVRQTTIENRKKFGYSQGLQDATQKDVDAVMVDELINEEIAQSAVQSALSGNQIISSIQANEALDVISRLSRLGISKEEIVSVLNLSIAQRLVRTLCESCKEALEPTEEDKNKIKELGGSVISEQDLKDLVIFKPKGCNDCGFTGYKGRVGVFERIIFNNKVKSLVSKNLSRPELKKALQDEGFVTINQNAILKLVQGITSKSELERVLGVNL